jgi:hypothetical protein
MNEFVELVPYLKFTLVMFNIYLFARMITRECVRIDWDHNKKFLSR